MSVIIGIVHRVDLVMWVFKVHWIYFGLMTNNCSLDRSWDVCMIIFVELFGSWSIIWLFWRICSIDDFCLIKMVIWKENYSIFHHPASTIIALFCGWYYMYNSPPLGVELMSSLVYDRICIDTVNLYFYGCVDIDLVQSGVERNWPSLCWQ